ncbi:hypothetical protein C9885_29940, partial [Klebsiella pneumoniae]
YPGLRLGYVVIPRPLVSDLKHAHAELYRGGHSLIQIYPGLRLGYVVIPRPLVSDLKHAHAELYRGGHS